MFFDLEEAKNRLNVIGMNKNSKWVISVDGFRSEVLNTHFEVRLSMKPFSFLIEEENDDIDLQYWNDNIHELKFDLERF